MASITNLALFGFHTYTHQWNVHKKWYKWYSYNILCTNNQIWPCLAFSHTTYASHTPHQLNVDKRRHKMLPILSTIHSTTNLAFFGIFTYYIPYHIPHHWNMLKEWCKMMSIMCTTHDVTHVWLYCGHCTLLLWWHDFYWVLLCYTCAWNSILQIYAPVCLCLALLEFVCIFSDFWGLYATCPSKTAFFRYIHNISYLAMFDFVTVVFLWSHNFFQIFPNFLEFFMLHFMLIQYFVNILCYSLFALVSFAVI